MADILYLSQLTNGRQTSVQLTTNTLVALSFKVGGVGGTLLTKAILDNLITLQNGSDALSLHNHDTAYFTKTQLNQTSPPSGASQIGVNFSPTNYTAGSPHVEAHLSGINSALGSIVLSDFSDATFNIYDNVDTTKKIMFQASGIATATTRTITMPDANVNLGLVLTAIQRDGSVAFTANQPMGGFKFTGLSAGTTAGDSVRYEQAILASGVNAFAADQSFGGFKATNVADPVSAQDAVTLSYLNARLNGLKPKQSVYVATTANITLSGEQTIDGVLTSASRVLVKNQTAPAENGIYVSAAGAWSRAADFDSLSPVDEINGSWVPVQQGTVSAGIVYVQYGTVTTLGTDAINFEFYNPIAGLIGGDMITFAGSTFSVDLATVSGLESTNPGNVAGQLRIKLEATNPSLQIDGSNQLGIKFAPTGAILSTGTGVAVQADGSTLEISSNALRVKDAGITLAKLASNSVDENKIVSSTFSATGAVTGGGGSKIAVQVDNSSIEINTNALRLKAAGVQNTHVNSNVFDQSTITGGAGVAAAVQSAPLVQKTFVAGETFAADTSFAVRLAISGETAGRVYKADKDASASAKYMVIGIARSVAGVSAGQNINVVMLGTATLGANDTPFAGGNVGLELYAGTAGAFILGSSLTNATNEAAFCLGVIQGTTSIWVDFKQLRGIN